MPTDKEIEPVIANEAFWIDAHYFVAANEDHKCKNQRNDFSITEFLSVTALLDWRIASITANLAACFTGFLQVQKSNAG